jgi:hypothetical protein
VGQSPQQQTYIKQIKGLQQHNDRRETHNQKLGRDMPQEKNRKG